MDWHLLPKQMRALNQWVCADDKKQPRNASNGEFAEVNNEDTWSSFEQACKCAVANGWDIGFILAESDSFTIIDLDNKPHNPAPPAMLKVHQDILNGADTYIERSTSGTGYHVIVEGHAPKPIKTDWIEMYSSHRLMICTGDIVKDLPVAIGETLITLIDQHFGAQSTYVDPLGDLPDQAPGLDELSDADVLDKCHNAENGDKFARLWDGQLDDYNGDHSRADSALLNLLCFMTPHNEQVRRLFKQSKLYRPNQRNRASNKYLNYSILKWRSENVPINIDDYRLDQEEQHGPKSSAPVIPQAPAPIKEEPAQAIPSAPSVPPVAPNLPKAPRPAASDFPPGIIGELASYALATSYNQIPEGSLSAAIGYMCGLMARGYHINGLGLNQYIAFITDSGIGKEGGKRAIRAVHDKVYEKVPAAQYCVGGADFSAGVSMVKELAENPCMLGVAGEIGMTLKLMLDHRASSHVKELKRALTDCWSESGPHGKLNSRKYSDRSKNGSDVRRPALSILGESVPSHFYGALTVEAANDGFIPRWLVIEYIGIRPYPNRKPPEAPPVAMVERLQEIYIASKTAQDAGQMIGVGMAKDAEVAFHAFEDEIVERVRALPPEHPVKAILNRTNEKSLKLAALLAACANPLAPCITLEQAKWAMAFITKCDGHMIARFEDGSVGEDEDSFEGLVRACIRNYQTLSPAKRLDHKCPKCLVDSQLIPRAVLKHYLKQRAAFKNHRFGALKAVDMAISDAITDGMLVAIPNSEKAKLGMRGGDAYVLGSGW